MTIRSPLSNIVPILELFDEVPLPDGKLYNISMSKLYVKQEGQWSESDLSVNHLLNLIADLSSDDLREILKNSVGNSVASQWREKILFNKL